MHVGTAGNNGKGLVAVGVRHPSRPVWSTRGHVVRGVGFLVRCRARVREGERVSSPGRFGTRCASMGSWAPVRATRQGSVGVL
jgi:hypothetical protein